MNVLETGTVLGFGYAENRHDHMSQPEALEGRSNLSMEDAFVETVKGLKMAGWNGTGMDSGADGLNMVESRGLKYYVEGGRFHLAYNFVVEWKKHW